MKLILAADHAGFALKEAVKEFLNRSDVEFEDLGTDSDASVNWADYGARAARRVSESPDRLRGVIICGTGIGMCMVANKFKNVRAALCHDEYTAEMSRRHNNANVLNIGARVLDAKQTLRIIDIWLNTPFDGGRHQVRLDYIHDTVEKENFK